MNESVNIEHLIPQKAPFVMIDTLIHSGDLSTRSRFTVKSDNVLMEGKNFSAAGMVENIAQTAAARVGLIAMQLNSRPPVGYIAAIKNLEIFALPEAGDEIETEITIKNHVFDVTIIQGKITCQDRLLGECEMKIFIKQEK
jgi:predicted hotdog family 3-hydroxylacyl-ACP dehydratase